MRYIILCCYLLMACTAGAQQADSNANALYFAQGILHDFGTIPEGPQAVYSFEFVNRSKTAVIILNAVSPCGCLVPTYSKEPIAPGKTGYILLNYRTRGRTGPFFKDVRVHTTLEGKWNIFNITIKGIVEKAGEADGEK